MAEQSLQLSPEEDELVETFLTNNNFLEEWKNIFRAKCDLKNSLLKFINSNNVNSIPAHSDMLRAFSRCLPEDIKVAIIGHDPVGDKDFPTGFSCSFAKGKKLDINVRNDRPMLYEEGRRIAILHDVLVDAGFLEHGGTYDCCHEIWAEKGVLLFNTSITVNEFEIWAEFIKQILFQVVKKSQQKPLFFLFWGSHAYNIGTWLSSKLQRRKCWVETVKDGDHTERIDERVPLVLFIGDHPTFSLDRDKYMYKKQAFNQFRTIKTKYPDLFTLPNLKCSELDPNPSVPGSNPAGFKFGSKVDAGFKLFPVDFNKRQK